MTLGTQILKNNWKVFVDSFPYAKNIDEILELAKVFYIPEWDIFRQSLPKLDEKITTIIPLCKLPFNPMIIEKKCDLDEEGDKKAREIYLLCQDDVKSPDITVIIFYLSERFYQHPIVFSFDPSTINCDDKGTWVTPSIVEPRELIDKYRSDPESDDALAFRAVVGTASVQIMRILSVVNSPKIIDVEKTDFTKLNKSRLRRDKSPLIDYHIINLKRHIKQNLTANPDAEGNRAFHWRRGHFKARSTGVFWWNPHTAGKKEFGEIKSAYIA